MILRWGYADCPRPKVPFEYYRGYCMAWLEQRGDKFRIAFRFRGEKFRVNLKATEPKEANGCLARLEENLRLVERGRLDVPPGADLGLFLISDGKLEKPVAVVRTVRLSELFRTYQTEFTAGAKEVITRAMEDIHMKHLTRIIGGDILLASVTAGTVQKFVDARSRDEFNGHPVKAKTVRKAVATFRVVWNWAHRQGHVPTKFPEVKLVFPKEKQPEPFRTYDQIQAIVARGGIDKRRERELWDGLFLNPKEIDECSNMSAERRGPAISIRFWLLPPTPGPGAANYSGRESRTSTSTQSWSFYVKRSETVTGRRFAPWT